jgi:hypothetical protein
VVGSGVGAAAGAATEGIRSSLPDPLLEAASQLVYQLLHDSRMYPYMDWCVGVFRTASGVETVIVNSDGQAISRWGCSCRVRRGCCSPIPV